MSIFPWESGGWLESRIAESPGASSGALTADADPLVAGQRHLDRLADKLREHGRRQIRVRGM
ncbi:MAG: hypothetical protein F9K25_18090 [Candidatus Contendobacter sp.]|nr:MAG: hypothetical protein F9K25_18090 [Candidatus Contendobacter sp.]